MSMDPRIAERRREVTEGAARKSLGGLLRLFVVVAVLVLIGWFVQSPLFQVQDLAVYGIVNSDAERILMEAELVQGRPLVWVRPNAIADEIKEDPWVADATVGVVFPDQVEVVVNERTAAAWVIGGVSRLLVTSDGFVVPAGDTTFEVPVIRLPAVQPADVGTPIDDDRVVGGVLFLAALPPGVASGGELLEREGELWFIRPGMQVRLGRPVEMAAKAAALTALAQQGIPSDAIVHLVAPARPAVEVPGAEPPPEETPPPDDEH